jgi:hypothetical protein
MSSIFSRRIEKTPRFTVAQQEDLYSRVHSAKLDWANSIEIEREMGKGYAQVVLKCLAWHHVDDVECTIEFRKRVVDALTLGCKM